jgi:hypothetical protein
MTILPFTVAGSFNSFVKYRQYYLPTLTFFNTQEANKFK